MTWFYVINDVGKTLSIPTNVDSPEIDNVLYTIKMQKPNKDNISVNASGVLIGSEKYAQHTFEVNELDQAGIWKAQAILSGGGKLLHSDIVSFKVHRKI